MTEKLLTGTLSLNTNKQNFLLTLNLSALIRFSHIDAFSDRFITCFDQSHVSVKRSPRCLCMSVSLSSISFIKRRGCNTGYSHRESFVSVERDEFH